LTTSSIHPKDVKFLKQNKHQNNSSKILIKQIKNIQIFKHQKNTQEKQKILYQMKNKGLLK